MKCLHWVFFTNLMLAVILLTGGSVFAQQVQIPVTVTVTLQTPSKPVTASQLCVNGKTINPFGPAVRVDCPAPAATDTKNSPTLKDAPAGPSSQTQVMVTF